MGAALKIETISPKKPKLSIGAKIGIAFGGLIVTYFAVVFIAMAIFWYTSPERAEALQRIEAGEIERQGIRDWIMF
jgi:hypothetical protein